MPRYLFAVVTLSATLASLACHTPPPRSEFPTIWRSLLSGAVKTVRLEGDHLYVENQLTEAQRQAGTSNVADLVRVGGVYRGEGSSRPSCATCSAQTYPIEVTLLTNSRIEGWTMDYPSDDRFDCATCTHSKASQRVTFVWVPQ